MNIIKKIKASTLEPNKVYGIKITNISENTEKFVEGMFIGNILNVNNISYKKIKIAMMSDNDRFYFKVKNENNYSYISAKKGYVSLTFSDNAERLTFFEIMSSDSFDTTIEENVSFCDYQETEKEEKITKIDADLEFWLKHSENNTRTFAKPYFKILVKNEKQKEIFENEYNVEKIVDKVLYIPFTMDVKSSDIKKIMEKNNMDYYEHFVSVNKDWYWHIDKNQL